jgi:hypothetical protein
LGKYGGAILLPVKAGKKELNQAAGVVIGATLCVAEGDFPARNSAGA